MENEQLIQGYFNKSLSHAENAEVLRLLANDTVFKTQFNDYKNVQAAFKLNEKEQLKAQLNNLGQKSARPYTKSVFRKVAVFAVASCLIVSLFYVNSRNTPSALYDHYYDSYPNVYQPIVRGNDTTENTKAFAAYENKAYLKAQEEFENLLETTTDHNITFYYAMSLINQDKIIEAKSILDSLKTKQHDFLAEVYWYSALINIKTENTKEAIQNLGELKKLNTQFKSTEISELLQKLN
ncbi:MAG: hypothetical protein WA775_05990 [Psychroserpens sp.]|uniref:tetratricopeptide repeat protein n=1 Tax=Psychroserpens sp. TaxID=2020870 RepID=UPI003C85E6F2